MKRGKEYAISRGLICIVVFIGTYLMMINEHISIKVVVVPSLTIIALVSCIIGMPLSKKMIRIGDSIKKKILQILYYFVLLILSFVVVGLLWTIIYTIYSRVPQSSDFSAELGKALMVVFCCAISCVFIIVPYLQAIVVLMIRRCKKVSSGK